MKKTLFMLLCCALLGGAVTFTGLGYDKILLMDWNVRGYPEKTQELRALFTQELKALSPQIFCVQEIANRDRVDTFLATETGFDKVAFQNSSDGQDNAIFFTKDVQVVDIPDPSGFSHPAQAAYFKYQGLDAVVITVHLAYTDRTQRAKERRLLACIAEKALEIDPDVIIAGDFNTTGAPGDTIEELAAAAGLKVLPDGTSAKLPTTYSGNYYDYILVSPDLYSEESTQYCYVPPATTDPATIDEVEEMYKKISDHRPVLAAFRTDSQYADCSNWPPSLGTFDWDCASSQELLPNPPSASCSAVSLGFIDAVGERITVVNNTDSSIDLGGWSLSDGEGRYTFPPNTIIEAYGSYTIGMETYNPTHYNRGLYLNNRHDEVYLINPAGEICDQRIW